MSSISQLSLFQITLTSVRVSWAGLLERSDCADSLIVKHFKGDNTNDFMMSDPLDTETNSYIVRDVVPNQMYTYQVQFSSFRAITRFHFMHFFSP